MEKYPFDEKTMRKFKDLKEALRVYSAQGIPNRRIVFLFNEANEIRFLNVSVNARFIDTESGKKFLESVIGKSKTRELAFRKAYDEWKNKYQEVKTRKIAVKEPISNTETSSIEKSVNE